MRRLERPCSVCCHHILSSTQRCFRVPGTTAVHPNKTWTRRPVDVVGNIGATVLLSARTVTNIVIQFRAIIVSPVTTGVLMGWRGGRQSHSCIPCFFHGLCKIPYHGNIQSLHSGGKLLIVQHRGSPSPEKSRSSTSGGSSKPYA
jgi:hypothetical protein